MTCVRSLTVTLFEGSYLLLPFIGSYYAVTLFALTCGSVGLCADPVNLLWRWPSWLRIFRCNHHCLWKWDTWCSIHLAIRQRWYTASFIRSKMNCRLMDSSASFFMPLSWKFRLPSRLSRKVSFVPWIRQIWIWIPSNLVYQSYWVQRLTRVLIVLEHKNLEFLILLTTHASRPIPSGT